MANGAIALSFYGLAIALLRSVQRSYQNSLRPLLQLLGVLFLISGTACGLRIKVIEPTPWSLALQFLTALVASVTAFTLIRHPLLAIFPEGNAQEHWEKDMALSRETNENIQRLNTELEQRVAERT